MARVDTYPGTGASVAVQAAAIAMVRPSRLGRAVAVHVVGRLTPPVVSVLLPMLKALGERDRDQVLIVLDDGAVREPLRQLPDTVNLLLVPDVAGLWGRLRALQQALAVVAGYRPMRELHLHGVVPALAGVRVIRSLAVPPAEVSFMPHGSRALTHPGLPRQLLWRMLRHALRLDPLARLPQAPTERVAGGELPPRPGQRNDGAGPVPDVDHAGTAWHGAAAAAFFEQPRNEAKRPLLMASSLTASRDAVDRYVRIAILLGDAGLGMGFNWVAPDRSAHDAALRAAGIGHFPAADGDELLRAQRFGSAWVYVAPVEEGGFPIRLVEAMASGLPCVALDTPTHREVVAHGRTGFLCADLAALLEQVAALVDSAPLRQSIGQAAREQARLRFSEAAVRQRVTGGTDDVPAPSATAGGGRA